MPPKQVQRKEHWYDKLIDRQLERAAITTIAGFAKLFTEAGKVLEI